MESSNSDTGESLIEKENGEVQESNSDLQIEEEESELQADPSLLKWIKDMIVKSGIFQSVEGSKGVNTFWKKNARIQKLVSSFFLHDNQQYLFFVAEMPHHPASTHSKLYEKESDNGGNTSSPEITHLHASLKIGIIMKNKINNLLFFMKEAGKEVTPDNVENVVSFGFIQGNPLESLLEIVKNQFAPNLLSYKTQWPDSILKDFSSQLHKFLASLTETTYRSKGSTVLYVPVETITNIKEARKQKDLVSRLENALMHWISQIKDVLQEKDSIENAENSGPLSEIEYWRSRAKDLMNITKQIEREDVKTIVQVMEHSSYLKPFQQYAGEIQQGCSEALENLKFLSTLKEPCEKLAKADPEDIPKILPEILQTIVMIWNIPNSYNTSDRLTSLLKKISNEIIYRCCSIISLDDIFSGNVNKSIKALQKSIRAGQFWKNICRRTFEKATQQLGPGQNAKRFEYEEKSVVAEVNAFVERCKDLLDVCEAQIQFGAGEDNDHGNNGLPLFGGTKGPEITKSLLDIRISFKKLIHDLKNLNYPILNVKSTKWHDDHGKFNNGVKDLEMIMGNVMTSAFDNVNTVESGVELLEAFSYLAKRETIKNNVVSQSEKIYSIFSQQLENVERIFEQGKANPRNVLEPFYPQRAGEAIFCFNLLNRIQRDKKIIESAHFLPRKRDYEEMCAKYDIIRSSIEKQINHLYKKWIDSIQENISQLLDCPILTKYDGLLETNFNKTLLIAYEEARYWSKLPFDVPNSLQELVAKEENYRICRANVNLVARDYNNIMRSLNQEQYKLFKERIYRLETKINPGLTSVHWSSKNMIDIFCQECRKHCRDLKNTIDDYKSNIRRIYENCQTMMNTELIKIEQKKVYTDTLFEKTQSKHRSFVRLQLQSAHNNIVNMMKHIYQYFAGDKQEVQEEWKGLVMKIENRIDNALRQTVKKSLQKLSHAINGDKLSQDSSGNPLFIVKLLLVEIDNESIAALKPSVDELSEIVNKVSQQLIRIISVVPRMSAVLEDELFHVKEGEERAVSASENVADGAVPRKEKKKKLPDHLEKMKSDNNDRDVDTIVGAILDGLKRINNDVKLYLDGWESEFKETLLIRNNEDKQVRRFADKPPHTIKKEGIEKYGEKDAKDREESKTIGYLQIDCSLIKSSLAQTCNSWKDKLLNQLHTTAQKELSRIYETFRKQTIALNEEPQTQDMLSKKIELLSKLQRDQERYAQKFALITEQYQVLKEYEFPVKEDEMEKLSKLNDTGEDFNKTLVKAKKSLDTHSQRFQIKLRADLDMFMKSVAALKSEFAIKGPYNANVTVDQAMDIIKEYRVKVSGKIMEETKLKSGCKIFGWDVPPFKELRELNKDLNFMDKVWSVRRDWDYTWDSYKVCPFCDIKVESMEQKVVEKMKVVNEMGRDMRDWGVWVDLKDRLNQFKRALPLIQHLKNPALRERHWVELSTIVGSQNNLDYNDKSFTLETIFKLGFESHAEDIATLSNTAGQQLGIERDIDKIADTWAKLELDIEEYKQYFVLKSSEEIFTALEENMVTLGAMKISPYVSAFLHRVSEWERILSKLSEIIELLLTVQKQWKYLFNIFEVEDIQKQLPEETKTFKTVNTKWKALMTDMNEVRIAKIAVQKDGLYMSLSDMNKKLEIIQKHLDDYLEVKRQAFPRFYFLSDGDLLEILGQSKDPNAVQKHLEKCFEGIYKLKIGSLNNARQKDSVIASAMISKGGEQVQFNHNIHLEGPVEKWLSNIEAAMRAAVKRNLLKCYTDLCRTSNREKWVEWPGQLLITASQIFWTKKIEEALQKIKTAKKNPLKELKKQWIIYLKKYTTMVRMDIANLTRNKLIALLTIEVHAKEVIERLIKMGCESVEDFEWLKQLRFYWDTEKDECIVNQISATINYDYEYLGNSGRLVITPLTERCYMTLTTAIQMKRGGLPQGPAGTGKTETVKDLGKAIAKYVIVFNCSDGLDYQSMGRMFSGLVQTGAWSCFDEFNRIEPEVLSVVAQQIFQILSAITAGLKTFIFQGQEIPIVPTCGIFVTMNPGYAGRSELPDNLKALLRPISMMVPNSELICAIKLYSLGFEQADMLARKIASLYSLMSQQLSKQTHYDFNLRNIIAVLSAAGQLKREQPTADEDLLLLVACKNMNLPKFVSEDIPLFHALIADLFPTVEAPETNQLNELKDALDESLVSNGYQKNKYIIDKAVQLYETMNTRHGVMVVGNTGSGKSVTWRTLQNALTKLSASGNKKYNKVQDFVLNPKAISNDELYGNYDKGRDWKNGVLAVIMKDTCADTSPDQKWIVFDGPVDTLWIESMNTVLDDNKILTLISGLRITLTSQISLLFEVQDLAVASPATVSRCGMVFFDENDLGWKPYMETWLQRRKTYEEKIKSPNPEGVYQLLQNLVSKFVEKALKTKESCREIISTSPISSVRSLCHMFDSVAVPENGLDVRDEETYMEMIQKLFIFSMIWGVGGTVTEEGRKKMDMLYREFDPQFPSKETVYEYFVDPKTSMWKSWEERVNQTWKPPKEDLHKVLVPTVDTVRNSFIISSLINAEKHILVTGNTGTGKTVIVEHVLSQFDDQLSNSKCTACVINFSARTSSKKLQEIIESKVEKKFDTFAPPAGKQLVVFVDDFNMPQKDAFGSQPPLELLRQWIDYGFWYDRERQTKKNIRKMQLVCSMGPPGGGRTEISQRLQSRFNIINITFPSDVQIKRIYGILLKSRLQNMEEIKTLSDSLTQATLDIYKLVSSELRPIPSKSHYIFNMRDLSKVFLGIMDADHESMDNKEQCLRLWVHECYRVFHDRLNDESDRVWFKEKMNEKLVASFEVKWGSLFESNLPSLFGDVLTPGSYQEMSDLKKLKEELLLKLDDYNDLGKRRMNLVLFQYAIDHLCRIYRIIKQKRGHALLIGVGGSGRQSLTRLASYLADYEVFNIEITNNYKHREFRESLKELFMAAGTKNTAHVFLFSDTQIVEESFLEDINTLLSTGEVPNLFDADGLSQIYEQLKTEAIRERIPDRSDAVYKYFIEKCREQIHIVLCMTPVPSTIFRNRIRMFPSLVNCTTIDWFSEWPPYALTEVAQSFLEEAKFEDPHASREVIANIVVNIHNSVVETSHRMLKESKRHNYVTPTNFLELITGYIDLYKEKKNVIIENSGKLEKGLQTLEGARVQVEKMSVQLERQKQDALQKKKECEDLMVIILQEKSTADDKKQQVELEKNNIEREKEKAAKIKKEAEEELNKALPQLLAAEEALQTIDSKDLSEIKNYQTPHKLLKMVFSAVMVTLKKKGEWQEARNLLAAPQKFKEMLMTYKKDEMGEALLAKINKFTSKSDFDPEKVGNISYAAKGICTWVQAIEQYGRIALKVKPKRIALANAEAMVEKLEQDLHKAELQYKEVTEKVERLAKQYAQKEAEKEHTRKVKEETEEKLGRAEQLVGGLEGERERWTKTIEEYKVNLSNLAGDVLLAAAFLSYAGPFDGFYRTLLKDTWTKAVSKLHKVPVSSDFTFQSFLARPTDIRSWSIQGLPSDSFSIENGALVTRTIRRWALMIDPQNQANKWIKNMEKDSKLLVVDPKKEGLLRLLENAVKFGQAVLLQDITEDIDPTLEPILSRAIYKVAGRDVIKIGDREVDFHPNFRLYLTTKLSNPHYPPEVSTKTTIVNFAVTRQGLEDQLLATVVQKERPELEEHKNEIVLSVAAAKKRMEELESDILRLLSGSNQDTILDDLELIKTLQDSKKTSENIKKQLSNSQDTEKKIDTARNQYIKAAKRASILYFVLSDLGKIDPMYQFSLESYIDLFNTGIKKSDTPARMDLIQQRVEMLNDYHTYEVYRTTCQGLFERDKLLFSFHMCIKILEEQSKVNLEEYNFFLRGGVVVNKDSQMPNPCEWLPEQSWDNICELDKLPNFHGIAGNFEDANAEWKEWYQSTAAETMQLPSEWSTKGEGWNKMLIARALRQDRIIIMVKNFITEEIGEKFINPPINDIKQIYTGSNCHTPFIFVLSPGVDPTGKLEQLANGEGIPLNTLSLGQGQDKIATTYIEKSKTKGEWVFLANCHLMIKWMPKLEEIIEKFTEEQPHENFRLWLSSSPHDKFPITILQKARKITTEPPQGIKSNLIRLYNGISSPQFFKCKKHLPYQRLLFSLAFFHSLLLERAKFGTLGWNIPYDFNDSDFSISENILQLYLDKYEQTPWHALRYLIAEASYGGRVTDDMDRRILDVYIHQFFNDQVLTEIEYKLSSDPKYHIPKDGDLDTYHRYIRDLDNEDSPAAFGQHPNADISAQISRSSILLDSLASLTPPSSIINVVSSSGGDSSEKTNQNPADNSVYSMASELLDNRIPDLIDKSIAQKLDRTALNTVLLQEISRYNRLLVIIKRTLKDLMMGIKGEVVMSAELEEVYNSLLANKVPKNWQIAYPSMKPLGSWTRDLIQRIDQFRKWSEGDQPPVFWLSGFTFPSGFLTAVKQTTARAQLLAVDELSFEFNIIAPQTYYSKPKEGVYISGLFLEGAGWENEKHILTEPKPMELITKMPVIHFKPIVSRKKISKEMYQCPLYMYPVRSDLSFVISIDLKSGNVPPDYWVKRGTALLLSTSE